MYGMSLEINGKFGVTILLSSGDCACLITVCHLNGRLVQSLHSLQLMSHFTLAALRLAKQPICKPFTTSAAVRLIHEATLNLKLTEG